jgi:NADH-quinone oxidoreductase subunit C
MTVPWYRKETKMEPIPVPLLGPDIISPAQIPFLKEEIAKARQQAAGAAADSGSKPRPKRVVKPPKVPTWDITATDDATNLAGSINKALEVEAVSPEANALIVNPDHLLAFGKYVRDELHYELLSNITGVDYMGREGDRFEVVYHAYSLSQPQKPGLVFKARAPESKPELPSLFSLWKTCYLQEREIYDLYGITFTGHPNMKRIFFTAIRCARIMKRGIMKSRSNPSPAAGQAAITSGPKRAFPLATMWFIPRIGMWASGSRMNSKIIWST